MGLGAKQRSEPAYPTTIASKDFRRPGPGVVLASDLAREFKKNWTAKDNYAKALHVKEGNKHGYIDLYLTHYPERRSESEHGHPRTSHSGRRDYTPPSDPHRDGSRHRRDTDEEPTSYMDDESESDVDPRLRHK